MAGSCEGGMVVMLVQTYAVVVVVALIMYIMHLVFLCIMPAEVCQRRE